MVITPTVNGEIRRAGSAAALATARLRWPAAGSGGRENDIKMINIAVRTKSKFSTTCTGSKERNTAGAKQAWKQGS